MEMDLVGLSAFLVGMVGSTHCAGMCGGFAGLMSTAYPGTRFQRLARPIAANLGRLTTYLVLGGVTGELGSIILGPNLSTPWGQVSFGPIVAGIVTILLAFHLAGWWPILAAIERVGGKVWQRIAPAARRVLPVRTTRAAFAFGLLWGFLPCGMVYGALTWAASSGSAANGAFLMFAFGVGTLPMLLAIGVFADHLNRFVRRTWVRQAVGVFLVVLGIWTLLSAGTHPTHAHHDLSIGTPLPH